jgi:hypothetical protein
MRSGELQCGPDLAGVEFGFSGQNLDPVFLTPRQLTEPCHDLPHVGAPRQGGSPRMIRTAIDDPGMIQDVYSFDDETFQQGRGAYCFSLSTISKTTFGTFAETKRCTRG